MTIRRTSITSLSLALFAVACSSDPASSPETGGTSSTVGSTGGASSSSSQSSGGSSSKATSTPSATGGAQNATGGTSSKATGGSSASNTAAATGGKTSSVNGTGGTRASGGTSSKASGGTPSTGGSIANPGGGTTSKATGGEPATGGTQNNGGAQATGGTQNNGGAQATGGTQNNGGTQATGGTSSVIVENVVVTSASNAYWKTATFTESTGNANVTVNDSSASQTWDGFGGAFNEKGWSYLTTEALQQEAIELLFGKDGCNFAWGRIPIGASDYAMDRYSLNETSGDTEMTKFSIDRDKQKLIPYIKAAQQVKSDIRFWASPWSPPTWMKTGPYNPGSGPSHSNFDGGVMKGDDTTLKALALYFVKFVQAYGEQGIKIDIVAPQNEPNYEQNYPSCHWEPTTFVNFVGKFLGPALSDANLTTKVMDGTLSNPNGDAKIGSDVLSDGNAKKYIGAIGVQWGMSDTNNVNPLKNAGIPIWLSETKCGGQMNSTAPAPNDFSYAKETWGYITGAIKNGLTAYNAWNMVLDPLGVGIDDTRSWPQNALLVVNSGKITKTPAYYVFRHFSQFVDVGAKVVSTSGGDAIGFKNPDGSIVAVLFSNSASSNYTVSIGGKKLQFDMPANGWATVKYKP